MTEIAGKLERGNETGTEMDGFEQPRLHMLHTIHATKKWRREELLTDKRLKSTNNCR